VSEPTTSVGPGGMLAGRDITIKGPVTHAHYHGWGQGLSSVVYNPAGYYAKLDLERFTGRREVIAKINNFIAVNRQGWVDIQGEAGVGKSALAAHLVAENDWFYHYTHVDFPDAQSPENARKNLAAQLISVYGLEEDCAPGGRLPTHAGSAQYLAQVLEKAAARRDQVAAGRPIVLVIDTLPDLTVPGGHADRRSPPPLGFPARLPAKVFVIVTRRPGPSLPAIRDPLPLHVHIGDSHHVAANESPNICDIRQYLRDLLYGDKQDDQLVRKLQNFGRAPEEFIETLVTRCAGSWIYVKYVLDDVRHGKRTPEAVLSLPRGLPRYYLDEFQWQQERDRGQWERLLRPALATLAALRRPVTIGELTRFIVGDVDTVALRSWLDNDMGAFLYRGRNSDGEPNYEIGHQSLRDVVADPRPPRDLGPATEDEGAAEDEGYARDDLIWELPKELQAAHTVIATDLIRENDRDWPAADQYVRNTLAEHAAHANLLDQLVTDPGFLLSCQPSSVLLRRRYLTERGLPAFRAYEATLNEWSDLPEDATAERAWRLHVWARKAGAGDLAVASGKLAGRQPMIQAAVWTGTTHRVIHAHDDPVQALAVLAAPVGHPLLASGGIDGRVLLWDPDTGTSRGELTAPRKRRERGNSRRWEASVSQDDQDDEPPTAHDDWVTAAAAVPAPDRKALLVTGARDGAIRIWDPQKQQLVSTPLTGRSQTVDVLTTLQRADDRTLVATGSADGTIRFWDPGGGAPAVNSLPTGGGEVTAVAAVPAQAGQLLATGSSDGSVRLWDPQTGRRWPPRPGDGPDAPLTSHQGPVRAIASVTVADDRTLLATGGKDGMRIHFWHPGEKRLTGSSVTAHTSAVNAIAVATLAHRTLFVTAGQDRKIRLWDSDTRATASFPVHARWVNAITTVALPDGRLLIATGGSDGKIELQELYESADGTLAITVSSADHLGAVTSMAAAAMAGRPVLISGGKDRMVRLWDPDTAKPVRRAPLAGHMSSVSAVAALPPSGGRATIATSGLDGTVRWWDDPLAARPAARPLRRFGPVYAMAAVRLPGGRTLLATGGSDGIVRLWEPSADEPVGPGLKGHVGAVNAIASARLTDETTLLVSGGSDGSVRFWDPVAGRPVRGPVLGYGGRIRAVAAVRLPEGDTLVAAGGDYGAVQVQVWNGTGQPTMIEPPDDRAAAINAIAVVELPDQILLATGDDNGAVRLWDARTGMPAAGTPSGLLAGHNGPVKAIVSLGQVGGRRLLATGGDDKTILIWAFADC
jgi:WD40 repeat protein